MGIVDGFARRFGYEPAKAVEDRIKEEIDKYRADNQQPMFNSVVIHDKAASIPRFNAVGRNKAILAEFWINPVYGQPRLLDLRTVKQLARQNIGSMAIEKILDMIAQEDWVIAPKPGKEDKFDKKHAEAIVEFLNNPNRNNETFESILRKVVRGILETDDGTIVKVFSEYEERQVESQTNITSQGYPPDKVPKENAQLIEIFAEDGSAFLKQTDEHGYLQHFFEYSFIIPRRPIAFIPREICYISANVRPGSPYGLSPFEAIVNIVSYVTEAQLYNNRFYLNSSYPAFHVDLPNVKAMEDMERWTEWFRDHFMGSEKSYQALITNQGAKVEPLTFTPEAVQNLQMQKWYTNLVLAKLKIPPSIVGLTEDVNRATSGQQTATFRASAVKPLEKIVEREFTGKIISELDPDGCCAFKFVEYTDLDEEERRSRIHVAYLDRGVLSINEVREDIGNAPIRNSVADETVRTYADRVRVEGMARRGEKPKKPAPSDSPSFQGHEDTDEGKDRAPRKYIGMCANCSDKVYTTNILEHEGHNIMRGGGFKKLLS